MTTAVAMWVKCSMTTGCGKWDILNRVGILENRDWTALIQKAASRAAFLLILLEEKIRSWSQKGDNCDPIQAEIFAVALFSEPAKK